MKIEDLHKKFLECESICIDTRKIKRNWMFLALKGENFNANSFAKEAIEKGAKYIVIDDAGFYIDERTILVDNSLETLQELAKFHRAFLNLPIIALTGSNGKTTTKELIHVVLSKKYNTKATIGNLNNHIGVPLTLLSFTTETEIGIVEMGANHQKEIAFLCELAKPNFGYITNFGKAHLEGFGGVEGVIKGKSEMYDYLRANKKIAFVNLEDPIQDAKTKEIERFTFRLNNSNANLIITAIVANPFVEVEFHRTIIKSKLIGLYNANNINLAILIGIYFNITDFEIKEAIEGYVPENNRSQLIQKGTNKIILDAYNANPSSMKVALENFVQLYEPNKIIILGDMFELGTESLDEHKNIVHQLVPQKNVTCFFIGHDFYENKTEQNNFVFFENFDKLVHFLKSSKIENNMILIKGSRGMALERVLDYV